jgi:hypothetical protein
VSQVSQISDEELRQKAHRLRRVDAQEIGARAREHAEAIEHILDLRRRLRVHEHGQSGEH